ncbi:MAG: hypothetical protein EOP07_17080 [Proteobacteria bacterium]|nr:MAG: hypothetical protein EOP07_17080 [Pseudomonadota bacterium]
MLKQSLCALGIISLVTACGDTPSKKTPRAPDNTPVYVPIAAPGGSFTATGASTGGSSAGSTTLTGATAPGASAAGAPAFALTAVQSTTWESNCYRFGATGDFSKKYWTFSADTMVSLLVKFTDAACTTPTKNTDGTAKIWSTWIVGSLVAAPLVDNWAVVTGTCTKGCTAEYKTALRASATVLNEGSKIGTAVPETFNTAEGKYVSYTKSTKVIDLEALSATLSAGGSLPATNSGAAPSGPTAPGASAAGAPAFALASVQSTTWESNCYRFGSSGDYSKKYWSFTNDTMVSLLVKYSDVACSLPTKNTDGTAKTWSTWIVGTLVATPNVDNWAVVSGTCTKGCTAEYKTALRASATVLNEGSKIGTAVPETFNTAEGKYVSFSKSAQFLDLEVLAASISSGVTTPATGGTAPVTPTVPVVIPQVESTGLALIGSLAGQSWNSCYVSKNTEAGVKVDRGFKRTLTFKKGADLKSDGYSSGLVVYTNVDCTGDILSTKTPYDFSNLVVVNAPQEGWILVTTQTCAASCSAVKSLMKLPTATEGLLEAGENKTAGTFYIETPRVYTLAP